jgi:hypothetical protein
MPEQKPIGVNFSVSTFDFSIEITPSLKLKNLKDNAHIKKILKQYVVDYSLENYYFHLIPETVSEDISVFEWLSNVDKSKIQPTILIKRKQKNEQLMDAANANMTLKVTLNSDKSFLYNLAAEMMRKNEEMLKELLKHSIEAMKNESQIQIQNAISSMKKEHLERKNELKKEHLEERNELKKLFKKDLDASKNIQKLANFISLFRRRILNCIEKKYEITFNNWSEMKSKKEYDYDIEEAVTECGLTLKDWETLQELSYYLNDLKLAEINTIQAYEYIDNLNDTKYEDYQTPLKNLVKLFEKK